MLTAGMQLVCEGGLRSLTVRGLAQRAGVNPGSFVYHFGSREAFLTELIECWYQPLFAGLQLHQAQAASPLVRLRSMVLQLLDFLIDQRVFVTHLLQDVAAGEPAAVAFVRSMGQRHPLLLFAAVREGQAAGELVSADPWQQMLFIMASLAAPVMLAQMVSGLVALPADWVSMEQQLALDRAAIIQRLDWALKGLRPEGEK